MNELSGILWLSVFLQGVAVILALRLIPISGKTLAWSALSLAFMLMTIRRAISLLNEQGYLNSNWNHAFSTEIVALSISVAIVVGVYLIRDIFIERIQNEQKLNSLIQAIEQSSAGIMVTDTQFTIEHINQHFSQKYFNSQQEWRNKNAGELDRLIVRAQTDNGRFGTFQELCDVASQRKIENVEFAMCSNSSDLHWESISVSPVFNNNVLTNYVFVFEDVTQKNHQEKELEKLALYDSLTHLPNRKLFVDRLTQQISLAKRSDESFAVLLLDLNRFKEVNDTLGHAVGDALLVQLGSRLQQMLREGDTIARMGGDEFLILLPRVNQDQIKIIVNKINHALSQPIVVNQFPLHVEASIGCAIYPDHGTDVKTLIKCADIAMYHAKKNHMDLSIYQSRIDKNSLIRLGIVNDLRLAIQNNELYLKYQPKIDLTSGRCVGVEALVRWGHKTRGEVMPEEFIPVAEQTGIIHDITKWVLQNALQQCVAWQKLGLYLNMSVNLSAKDLHDPGLITSLTGLFREHASCAQYLTLELTESTIMTDVKTSLAILGEISSMGVKLSIDDFGTGYSSLEYLARLPVNELKIDRSFVAKMISSQSDSVIVRSTIELAHNLGLSVVAEGVEHADTFDLLKSFHCDLAQGYHIFAPQTTSQLTKLLVSEQVA